MIILQPPPILADGFLKFAESIDSEVKLRGQKFTEIEICEKISSNFSSKIRFDFLLWVSDLNRILDCIGIITSDLNDLKNNKNSLKGDAVIRSEFLFQAFLGEFYRLKEISKIYISTISKAGILNNSNKKIFAGFYYEIFEWVYELRNNIIHQGVTFKNEDVNIDFSMFEDLSENDKARFVNLIKQSNTRENTLEIQCAIYLKVITEILKQFEAVQIKIMEVLSELILKYEELIQDKDNC